MDDTALFHGRHDAQRRSVALVPGRPAMPSHVVGQWQKLRANMRGESKAHWGWVEVYLTMTGMAGDNEQEQTAALAAFGGDVWKGADFDVVPSLADFLHGVRRIVCVRGWRDVGSVPLLV